MADVVVTVGADIAPLNADLKDAERSVAATIQKLKEAQIGLAHETRGLSSEYNKNAKALKELYDVQKNGLGFTAQTTTKIKALEQTQRALSASIVDSKGVYKDANEAIKTFDKSLLETAKPAGGISKVYSGLKTLANIIPGMGISGLILLVAGPLMDALEPWYQSITKISAANQSLKDNLANLNDVIKEANKDAGKQTADLKILYAAATDVNLSMKDRLAAVKGLQEEFPAFFKNIKAETILNGGAKAQYDELTLSIIATARAKAAKGKIDELEAKRLDIEFQKQKILIATANEAARAKETSATISTGGGIAGTGGTSTEGASIAQQREVIKRRRDAAIAIQDINIKSLQDQEDFLTKFVGLSKLAAAVEFEIKPPTVKKEKVEKAVKEIALKFSKGAAVAKIEVPIDITPPKASELADTIKKIGKVYSHEFDQLNQNIADVMKDSLVSALSGIGEAIGTAIGGGGDLAQSIFSTLFNVLEAGLKQLGEALIVLGTAKIAVENFGITPGIGTVVAGVATIALAALLKQAIPQFATGGFVSGPGSSTSDSINARLSAGEYVIKADAVKTYGRSFFDMINGGANLNRNRNFAGGGMVSGNIGGGQLITVEVVGKLAGTDMYLQNKRTALKIGRNG